MGLLRGSRRPDQRGAVAVMVAVMLSLLLIAAAFAIDLNMQRVAARDAQAAADLIALDVARELNGTSNSEVGPALAAAFAASRERNAGGLGLDPGLFTLQTGQLDASGRFDENGDSGAVPNAVRVVTRGGVDRLFTSGTGDVERAAVATAEEKACLRVSSYAASLDSGDSWLLDLLLGDVLGSDLKLQVLDPVSGLANVDVDLVDWFDALGPLVGADLNALSFEAVANTAVGLGQLMLAAATALERESGSSAQVSLLRQVAGGLNLGVGALTVTLGDLVDLGTGGASATDLAVNVLDVLGAAVAVANGENVLRADVPLNLTVPANAGGAIAGQGIRLDVGLKVGQKPVLSCAREVESSQISLVLTGNLLNLDLLGLARVSAPLHIEVDLANVRAVRGKVECTPSGGRTIPLAVSSSLVGVDLNVGIKDHPSLASDPLQINALGLLGGGIKIVEGSLRAYSGTPPLRPVDNRSLTIEDGDYSVDVPASTVGLGVPTLTTTTRLDVVPGLLGPLVSLVVGPVLDQIVGLVLTPLVSTLDRWLLAPLLDLLGTDIAGGTVGVSPTAECGVPVLQQ